MPETPKSKEPSQFDALVEELAEAMDTAVEWHRRFTPVGEGSGRARCLPGCE